MRRYWISLALLSASCGYHTDIATKYYEDGRAKPTVAIASMLDTTSFDVPWSIAEEITTMVADTIGNTGQIFLVQQGDEAYTENPFHANLAWVKREFPTQEFVVFLELVEHALSPSNPHRKHTSMQEVSRNLDMAVRLRVVDLRAEEPKIVLQEMVKDSYFIPKTLLPTDYQTVTWGSDAYASSPMGVAHTELSTQIAKRAAEYILLAKSR